MLLGAGILSAIDNRSPSNSNESSLGFRLQGLYQALSYIGGISGGSWLVVSNFINDNTPLWKMQDTNESVWNIDQTLLQGILELDPSQIQQKLYADAKHSPKGSNDMLWMSWLSGLLFEQKKTKSIHKRHIADMVYSKGGFVDNLVQSMIGQKKKGNSTVVAFFTKLSSSPKNSTSKIASGLFAYYERLHSEVTAKRQAGYYISLTDYWGRALSYNVFAADKQNPGISLSMATNNPSFLRHQQPFPIVASISTNLTSSNCYNSFLMEFTPYEFGSWDSYLKAFVPVKYLGTSFYNGTSSIPTELANTSMCILGYDTASFVMATSSSLFNRVLLVLYQFLSNSALKSLAAVEASLKLIGLGPDLVHLKNPEFHLGQAVISPNPFYGFHKGAKDIRDLLLTQNRDMFLIDGGDDGQNIPFQPFLVPERPVDVILAYDMTSDWNGYPNGTTLNQSQRRYHCANSSYMIPWFSLPENKSNDLRRAVFPFVPTEEELIKNGLNNHALFFGCDIQRDYPVMSTFIANSSFTSLSSTGYLPPLIIYNANSHLSFPTNYSTFQLQYNKTEIYRAMNNGFNLATNMNSTLYAVCLNCAFMKREFDRIRFGLNDNYNFNYTIPKTCEFCYNEYCWHKS